MTYEDQARAIGTEHGTNAASWVELDEATAEAIDRDGVFDQFMGTLPTSPLSGEWADGYSVEQLGEDCGCPAPTEGRQNTWLSAVLWDDWHATIADLADAYEEAYWQAFEAEILRKVETKE